MTQPAYRHELTAQYSSGLIGRQAKCTDKQNAYQQSQRLGGTPGNSLVLDNFAEVDRHGHKYQAGKRRGRARLRN
jgi:hypothetical protein